MQSTGERDAQIPPRSIDVLDEREGRVFALTLAAGFGILALVGYWKEIRVLTSLSLALGAVALVAALFVPRRLGPIRTAWMKFGEILGRITTPVLMAIVYYVLITPIAILRRAVRSKAVRRSSYWHPHQTPSAPSRMERQF